MYFQSKILKIFSSLFWWSFSLFFSDCLSPEQEQEQEQNRPFVHFIFAHWNSNPEGKKPIQEQRQQQTTMLVKWIKQRDVGERQTIWLLAETNPMFSWRCWPFFEKRNQKNFSLSLLPSNFTPRRFEFEFLFWLTWIFRLELICNQRHGEVCVISRLWVVPEVIRLPWHWTFVATSCLNWRCTTSTDIVAGNSTISSICT